MHPRILGNPINLGVVVDVLASPVILGIPKYLGVGLPLPVVGLDKELVPKVYSGHCFRPEGTNATGRVGVPASLYPGYQVTPVVQADIVISSVILGVSEHLGIGFPLGVVRMEAELAPHVFSW